MNKTLGILFLTLFFFTTDLEATSWQKLTVACGSENTAFRDIAIPTLATVYVVGGGEAIAVLGGGTAFAPGIICKSTDRGDSWVELSLPVVVEGYDGEVLRAIDCWNSRSCYAVGDNGKILKTENGGLSWSVFTAEDTRECLPDSPSPTLTDIRVVPGTGGDIAVAVGSLGNIWRTTNEGGTWSVLADVPTPECSTALSSVYFANGTTGWIVGSDSAIVKTITSGASWEAQTLPEDLGIFLGSVFARDSQVWVNGGVDICGSSDGGAIWDNPSRTIISTDGWLNIPFNESFFIDGSNGWAVGGMGGGIIRKTINGGAEWPNFYPFTDAATLSPEEQAVFEDITALDSDGDRMTLIPHLRDVEFYNASIGFIVGDDQTVLRRYIPSPGAEPEPPLVGLDEEDCADLIPAEGWSLACANGGSYLHIISGFRNSSTATCGAEAPVSVRLESLDGQTSESPVIASKDYLVGGADIAVGGFVTIDTTEGGTVSPSDLYDFFHPLPPVVPPAVVASPRPCLTIKMTVDSNNWLREIPPGGESNNVRVQTTTCGEGCVIEPPPAAEIGGEPPSPFPPARDKGKDGKGKKSFKKKPLKKELIKKKIENKKIEKKSK